VSRFGFGLAAALLVAALLLDASLPAPASRGEPVRIGSETSSLVCPYAVQPGGRAFLSLADVGAEPARAVVSIVPENPARAVSIPVALEPGQARTIRLHGRVPGIASAIVERTGGEIVASHSLWLPPRGGRGPRGGGAALCRRTGDGLLVVPHGSTAKAELDLVLFNPGTASADASISLIAGKNVLRPQRLEQVSVPPRSRTIVRLADFAFQRPEIAAVIQLNRGTVGAEALQRTASRVALIASTTQSPGAVTLAGAGGATTSFGLAAIGRDDAGITARLLSFAGSGAAAKIPQSIRGNTGLRLGFPRRGDGPVAYRVSVDVGSQVVAGAAWPVARGGTFDLAHATGAQPARRWGGVFGGPEQNAVTRILIANPGDDAAAITLRPLGGEERSIVVQAGSTESVPLARGAGTFAFELTSDQPVVPVIEAVALDLGPRPPKVRGIPRPPRPKVAFAFALAAQVLESRDLVPVEVDPRLGVPARFPGVPAL